MSSQDRESGKIVGAEVGERAAVSSDRRAHVGADEGFGHGRASARPNLPFHSAIVASVGWRLV